MKKEYRVGTDCGVPAILCNGVPISLDEVVTRLNNNELASQEDTTTATAPVAHPVYFIRAEYDNVEYTIISMVTSGVYDRSVEKLILNCIATEHNLTGKMFCSSCNLIGYATKKEAKAKGITIV